MSFSSDEVNYLVYRYLLESGFSHTTFAFLQESALKKSDIKGANVKPGALINFLQKGLQYIEVETHVDKDGSEIRCQSSFSLLTPHQCEIMDIDEEVYNNTKENKKYRKHAEANEKSVSLFKSPEVRIYEGHEREVFVLSWNPQFHLLATGSGDGTVRIWSVPLSSSDPVIKAPIVLVHETVSKGVKDVTTIAWHPSGEFLGTGSYDGKARIWNRNGNLKYTLLKHSGPIFSLKWNKLGDLLLTGSVDKTSIVWDASTGECRQQFEFHAAPVLDVDWKDSTTFASGSADSHIYVCQIGSPEPLNDFLGHKNEINAVKWDPSGNFLASCSDDGNAKIWSMESEEPVKELIGHTKEIYTLRWSPVIPEDEDGERLLATASFDSTVKIWNITTGECVHTLGSHKEAIYSVAWSPDGKYLASGSFDHTINVWSLAAPNGAKLLKTYIGESGVFELTWNGVGNRLGACYSEKTVAVLYLEGIM